MIYWFIGDYDYGLYILCFMAIGDLGLLEYYVTNSNLALHKNSKFPVAI